MSKLKKDNRKPVQVHKNTHAVLTALKEIDGRPIGIIVDQLVKDRYTDLYKGIQ